MHKIKGNPAVICAAFLLCAVLLCIAWIAGGNVVFAVGTENGIPEAEETVPPAADLALARTERDEQLATGLLAGQVKPVVRTVAVGMDAEDFSKTVSCTYAPVYVDGVFGGYCYALDGVAYFSVPGYCMMLGLPCESTAGEDGTIRYTVNGAELVLTPGEELYTANGRCFYAPGGVRALDGAVVLPAADLQKIFGAELSYDSAAARADADTAKLELLEPGDTFYADFDVYWLSRIVYAESGNQPLAGMIGVGNVVLNRVASETFPDTVQAVVFDTRSGSAQFSPVSTGAIYAAPTERAVIAAKLCFEGYNTVADSLYFMNPAACNGSWFEQSLTRVTTIGDHVFFV